MVKGMLAFAALAAACTVFAITTKDAESAPIQCAQFNNTLGLVGLDAIDGTVYARVFNHDNGCGCSDFRFRPSVTRATTALSVLLTAKGANRPVRVDLLDRTNCNSAYRVYMQ